MTTFVIAHGAWSGGWAWKKIRQRLGARGHEVFTPTYTGLGERAHLARPELGLETHVQDVLGVLEYEDLSDVVLLGHSYGGMVATVVADRAPQRIRRLAYLDAFAPRDGQALLDLVAPEERARRVALAKAEGEGWRMAPNPPPPDTGAEDLAWIGPRRVPLALKAFEQPAKLSGAADKLPRSYIYCTRSRPGDVFRQFRERARREGWQCFDLDASHSPNVTAPDTLAEILEVIAATR
ncbi:MAG TPA: alpha/beta fold hydrolase [Burkholderiales bacterium]|nr:alpha/beta fold hydrolase [Burkholderiales bacterium]